MKQKVLLLALLAQFFTFSASAHDAYVGGIYYNLDTTNKTATITYKGEDPYYSRYYSGSIRIPTNITYNNANYKVTAIGKDAFRYCTNLTSITIPSSVTSIGENAFWGCPNLTSITIPGGVTSIGSCAFYECSGLKTINIPNSVMTIGSYAFLRCTSLTSVKIPASVKEISLSTFNGCTSLSSCIIPASVTTIREWAFSDCSKLESINIPSSVTFIENSVFKGTPWYDSWYASQPDGPCYINSILYAYKGTMPENTSVVVNNGTTCIGGGAFKGCSNLVSIDIPQSVTSICSEAFAYSGLKTISIPTSLSYFGAGVFYKCTQLSTIEVPGFTESGGGVEESSYGSTWGSGKMFMGCTGLTSATLKEGIQKIYYAMFADCINLTTVTLPSTITNIPRYAFVNCDNLSIVKADMQVPPTIHSEAITNRFLATLYVPKGCKAAYEAAEYWNEFKRIKEYIKCDVNDDEAVDVLDVVDIARFVVGVPSESFDEYLADVNNDSEVNLGDAVSLVNDIAGEQNFVKAWSAPREVDTGDALTLSEGNGCLSLNLENERYYSAFQFDFYVPEGTDVTQMLLNAERKRQHQLLYNKVEDGHYRVAALSTSNNEFIGNNGELLNIALTGAGNSKVSVCNIHFFDAEGNDYRFEDIYGASPTSIRQIDNGELRMDNSIYNLVGQRLNKMQRGVNIAGGKKMIVK